MFADKKTLEVMNQMLRDYDHGNLNKILKEYESGNLAFVVRCKDCKYRPKKDANGDPVFPDDVCPCQCSEDPYYGWNPPSDWFCPKGEKVEQ